MQPLVDETPSPGGGGANGGLAIVRTSKHRRKQQ